MNNTPRGKLLPKNWFIVGIVGLLMDIVKIPGTIFGAIVRSTKQLVGLPNIIKKQDR